jgi:6-phosphogluconolactonase
MTGSASHDCVLVVGTYTQSMPHVQARGGGIHLLGFDTRTGTVSDGPLMAGIKNPTYVAVSRDGTRLYGVQELEEHEGAAIDTFAFDPVKRTLVRLSSVPAFGGCPCHVAIDAEDRRLFVSNYATGSFVTFPLDADGLPRADPHKVQRSGSGPNPDRQEGPHVHHGTPTPDGEHVLICDAGTDRILRHRFSDDAIEAEPNLVIEADPGTLPRHIAFLPDGSGFVVVHELGAKIDAYRYSAEGAERVGEVSTLPADWAGPTASAAIRVHPSGRFVYASNRGHDSIFGADLSGGLAALKPIGWWSTCGQAPRDVAIDPSGRFLVAANQDSHNLAVFRIDQATGALTLIGAREEIGSPVCLVFVPLP